MGLDKFNYDCEGQISLFDTFGEQMYVKRDWASEYFTEALLRGTGFEDGKKRVYELFKKFMPSDERIKALKKEYGTGGESFGFGVEIGLCGWESDAVGIEIQYKTTSGKEKKLFSWLEVEKRLHRLIDQGKYYKPIDNRPICESSKHVCNKEQIWEVADSLDDKEKCPHVCCRVCEVKGCGARCNGSSEPEADFYYCAPQGKWDKTCSTCNNWHFHRNGVRCQYGNCPENGYENYVGLSGGKKA